MNMKRGWSGDNQQEVGGEEGRTLRSEEDQRKLHIHI
jgi:hypothetical protein